jgi:glycosyltransferase involved in cell wall biosynthesis
VDILWVSHYYPPEVAAPSVRLHGLSREWLGLGHRVKVITGFPNHPKGEVFPAYRGRWTMSECMDGVSVIRCPLFTTPNRGVALKTAGHLSLMLSAVVSGMPRAGRCDVVIGSSPTLFSALGAWMISRVKRVPFVMEVRDLWPAIFVHLGVLKNRTLIRLLERLELFLYHQAAVVVPVTQAFALDLQRRGVPPSKIGVIPNSADLTAFSPAPKENDVRQALGLGGRFVVSYIGTHGISHGLDAVLDAAAECQDDPEIVFLFVGEGAERARLMEQAAARALSNVRFVPAQPLEQIAGFYAASDACLVPLRAIDQFAGFIPSKMFEIMASGRPVIGALEGEAKDILAQSGAALLVRPEDSRGLAQSVRRLRSDPGLAQRLGAQGRAFVEQHYGRPQLAQSYERLLRQAVRPASLKRRSTAFGVTP